MVTADAVPQAGKDNKEQNGGIYIRDQETDQKQNRPPATGVVIRTQPTRSPAPGSVFWPQKRMLFSEPDGA